MHKLKIALIGHSNDKQGIMAAIAGSEEPLSTLGIDIQTITREINREMIKIEIADTAGQERFRNIGAMPFMNNIDAAILIYDAQSWANFEIIRGWISEIYTPKILVARSEETGQNEVTSEQGRQLADENGAIFHEITNANGIVAACNAIATQVLRNKEQKILDNLVQWSLNGNLTINDVKKFIYQGIDLSKAISKLPKEADKEIKTMLEGYHKFEQEFRSNMTQFSNQKFNYKDNKILYSLFEISKNCKNTRGKFFSANKHSKDVEGILKNSGKFVISTETESKLNRTAIAMQMGIIDTDGIFIPKIDPLLNNLIDNLFDEEMEVMCVHNNLTKGTNMPGVIANLILEYNEGIRNKPSTSSSSSTDGSSSSTDGSSSSTDGSSSSTDDQRKCSIM